MHKMLNLFFSSGKLMALTFFIVSLAITLHRSMYHTAGEEIIHPSTLLTALFISTAMAGIYTGFRLSLLRWWSPLALIFVIFVVIAWSIRSPLLHCCFIIYATFIMIGLVMSKYLYLAKSDN